MTVADREAEQVLREAIRRRFPDHGIVGEEFGTENADAETVWVLDPIDGTISYIAGVALFGTMIGVLHRGRPVLGAIHQPITGELVIGTGSGTTFGDRPARVRDAPALRACTLLTTDPTLIIEHFGRSAYERFEALSREVGTYRGWGDCYGYLLVATGRADAMADPILNPWDLLPLIPVIEGAGGVITTWTGGDPVDGSSAVAASAGVHGAILRALSG